jgi:hypothetical protein
VELTHDLTDDTGALREALVWTVAAVVHRVDHPTVHGLETVAHVGQCAPDDDAHRVVEVRPLHLQLKVDLVDLVVPVVDDRVLEYGLFWFCYVSHLSLSVIELADIRCRGSERLWRCAE